MLAEGIREQTTPYIADRFGSSLQFDQILRIDDGHFVGCLDEAAVVCLHQ